MKKLLDFQENMKIDKIFIENLIKVSKMKVLKERDRQINRQIDRDKERERKRFIHGQIDIASNEFS